MLYVYLCLRGKIQENQYKFCNKNRTFYKQLTHSVLDIHNKYSSIKAS